jgi:alanine-glyoxylate transaminase/serine-glyoxylate transaminase/serine-pyruvate transaminase
MIPGPIEISDAVFEATSIRPPSHLAPGFKAAFGRSLAAMRTVWKADADAHPFVVAGGGTLAMEAAATNLMDCGETALVVNTGYFGDRMAEMLRRRGVEVLQVGAPIGGTVDPAEVERAVKGDLGKPPKAVFATHVDTSTGAMTDPEPIARIARENGVLSVFDGVCATAAERFEQAAWGADVYLTGSQKAIGLPAGLALWVASPRAMEARAGLKAAPPMTMDWQVWKPVLDAYEREDNAYFSTPATTLIPALEVALAELLSEGMDAVFARHQRAADKLRAGFAALGLERVAEASPANTLTALYWPEGADASALPRIKAHGAIVAGGLHPAIKARYFRVGHMGVVTADDAALERTLRAVAGGIGFDPSAIDDAVAAFRTGG